MQARTIARHAAPWLIIAFAGWVGVAGILPPSPVPADADPAEFSAERAFVHVEAIAGTDRPIGSPGSTAARDYLAGELQAMGAAVDLQHFAVPDYFGDGSGTIAAVNVIGRIPGTDPTGSIVLMGHYDTYPGALGANDAATAIAAVVETGRALLEGPPLRNDVLLVLIDCEEPAPRYGSTAFVEDHPAAGDVGLVLNFEAVGGAGASLLIETSGDEWALIGEYAAVHPHPVANSYFADLTDLLGGSDTDFAPFRDAGVPGFHFAYLHGSPIYHTPDDDPGSVRLSSLQHHGEHALSLAQHFGGLDLTDYQGEDEAVYFSLLGETVIRYPAGWGIVFVAAAGLLLAWVLATGRRAVRLSLPRVAGGAGALLALALGVAAAIDAVWRLLIAVFWGEGGPGVATAIVLFVVLLAAAGALTHLGLRGLERRIGGFEMEAGGVLAWWLLAALTAVLVPGAGYLFLWPAVAATLATGRCVLRGYVASGWWGRLAAFALVAVPTVVLTLPALDAFFQFAQPRPGNLDSQILDMAAAVGLLGALVAGLVLPYLRRALTREV